MLNIPTQVKDRFKRDSVKKFFQIYFPNGERDRIANNQLVADSVKLTESICSEEFLSFGLAENSLIEFETVGVGGLTDYIIDVYVEVNINDLTAAEIAEIEAGTWDGTVQRWGSVAYFRVKLGRFRVYDCPKDEDRINVHRKVKAITLGQFDEPNIYEQTKLALPLFAEGYTYQPLVVPLVLSQLAHDNEQILIDAGLTRHNIGYAGGNSETFTGLSFTATNTSGQTLKMAFDLTELNYTFTNQPTNYIRASSYNKANIRDWLSRFDTVLTGLNIDLTKPIKVGGTRNVYVNSIKELRDLVAQQVQYYDGVKYAAHGGAYNMLYPYVKYQGRTAADASTLQESYGFVDIDSGVKGFIAYYGYGILNPNNQEQSSYCYGNVYFPKSYRFVVQNVTARTSQTFTDSVTGQTGGWSYSMPSGYPLATTRLYFEPNGNEIGVSSWTGSYDMRKLINDYLEAFAYFAVPSRNGPVKLLRLDPSSVQETIDASLYSEYSIQANSAKLGTVFFKAKVGDSETGVIFQFGPGTGVYDMSENMVVPAIGTAADIKSFLTGQFVPYVQNLISDEISVEGRGLPYLEGGDYIKVEKSASTYSLGFITRRELTGIQNLWDQIETKGNKTK